MGDVERAGLLDREPVRHVVQDVGRCDEEVRLRVEPVSAVHVVAGREPVHAAPHAVHHAGEVVAVPARDVPAEGGEGFG
jgi:hypothetical protein